MTETNSRAEKAAEAQRVMRAARARQKQREPEGDASFDASTLFKGKSQRQHAEEAGRRRENRDAS